MSSDNEYNFPFRTNYELRIVFVWLAIGLLCYLCPFVFDVPRNVYHIFTVITCGIGLIIGRKGIEIYIRKSRLKGYKLSFLDPHSNDSLALFGITDKEVIKNVKKRR